MFSGEYPRLNASVDPIITISGVTNRKLKKSGYSFSFLFIVKKYIAARTIVITNH